MSIVDVSRDLIFDEEEGAWSTFLHLEGRSWAECLPGRYVLGNNIAGLRKMRKRAEFWT